MEYQQQLEKLLIVFDGDEEELKSAILRCLEQMFAKYFSELLELICPRATSNTEFANRLNSRLQEAGQKSEHIDSTEKISPKTLGRHRRGGLPKLSNWLRYSAVFQCFLEDENIANHDTANEIYARLKRVYLETTDESGWKEIERSKLYEASLTALPLTTTNDDIFDEIYAQLVNHGSDKPYTFTTGASQIVSNLIDNFENERVYLGKKLDGAWDIRYICDPGPGEEAPLAIVDSLVEAKNQNGMLKIVGTALCRGSNKELSWGETSTNFLIDDQLLGFIETDIWEFPAGFGFHQFKINPTLDLLEGFTVFHDVDSNKILESKCFAVKRDSLTHRALLQDVEQKMTKELERKLKMMDEN